MHFSSFVSKIQCNLCVFTEVTLLPSHNSPTVLRHLTSPGAKFRLDSCDISFPSDSHLRKARVSASLVHKQETQRPFCLSAVDA